MYYIPVVNVRQLCLCCHQTVSAKGTWPCIAVYTVCRS